MWGRAKKSLPSPTFLLAPKQPPFLSATNAIDFSRLWYWRSFMLWIVHASVCLKSWCFVAKRLNDWTVLLRPRYVGESLQPVSVCLSACVSQKTNVQISPNFLYTLPVAVAWSSSDHNVIRNVFAVLWMTFFHIVERVGQNQANVSLSSPGGGTGARSAVSDCVLSIWGTTEDSYFIILHEMAILLVKKGDVPVVNFNGTAYNACVIQIQRRQHSMVKNTILLIIWNFVLFYLCLWHHLLNGNHLERLGYSDIFYAKLDLSFSEISFTDCHKKPTSNLQC